MMKKITLALLAIFFLSTKSFSQTASCLNFDGVNDYCSKSIMSTQNSSLTVEARVNVTGTTSANEFLFYNGNSSTSGYGLYLAAGTNSLILIYGGLGTVPTGITLSNGSWNLVSLVMGNSTFSIYINGVSTFTYNAGTNPNTPAGGFAIGSNQAGTENFYGSIDDFRFWNRPLCASEVSFRASCQLAGNEPGLVAYYNFNQGISAGSNSTVTTLTDLTSNGNTCTLNNYALTGTTSNWTNALGVLNSNCASAVPVTATLSSAVIPSVCPGVAVTLSVSGGVQTYSWSTLANTQSISVSPSVTTVYSIIGTNSVNGCYGMAQQTVFAYPAVTVAISPATNTICSGNTLTLTAAGANTYSWSTAVSAASIAVSPSVNTVYSVLATAASTLGSCTATASTSLTVLTTPTVTVISTPTAICGGSTAVVSASGATTYSWNTAATTTSISVNPTVTTIYTVTGTTGNCSNVKTYTLTVNPIPTVVVASPTTCTTYTTNLTASGASTYSWSNGATSAAIAVTPSVSTNYTVIGTSAAGCTASAVSNVTVLPSPSITIANSSPTICSGNTATLTATGGSTYIWIGPTTVTNGLAFFPTTTGDYTVYATAANGCTVNGISSITVVTTPANFPTSTPTAICVGATATISVTGATNYTWLPGNINTNTIAVNPTITTTYTVIKSNANCVDTKTFVLTVNNLPGLSIIASSTIVCANNTLSLQGGGAATFTWAPGGVTGQSVVVSPSASVVYTLTASNGTCANTSTVSITTKANPTISIVPTSSVICNGFCTTLTVSGGNSYTWTATPASSSSLSGLTVVDCPTTTTSYSVAGSNTLGCVTGANQIVVVNPLPTFTATSNPPLVCVAANSTLSAQSLSGVSYSWSTGASTRTNQVSPLTTSVYSVTATFTATQCKRTNTVTVGVFVPTFAITGPTAVCVGGTITINASGSLVGNNAYVWAGGGYTSTGFPSFAVSPTVPTIYICTGTGTLSGVVCAATQTVLIGIYQNPTITAVVDRTLICKGETAYLTAGGGATYLWNTNQTGSTVPVSPTANSSTYTVVGTDANGCDGTATVQVRSQSCIGIKENALSQQVFIVYPNPSNGEFSIESDAAMNLKIVDELGREVKAISIKETNGFETKVSGLLPGVYFIVGEKGDQKMHQKIIVQ